MNIIKKLTFTVLVITFFVSDFAKSETKRLPLYEVGLAYGMGVTPDYPASDQSRFRFLAIPTFFYRGKTFRRDRSEGTRARIFESLSLKLDFSFSGSFPTNSKDNDARKGMQDLDWMGEFGPRLLWFNQLTSDTQLRISLPVRLVMTTDFSFTKHIGYNLNPSINLRVDNCYNKKSICFFGFDSSWVSSGVSDYFYSVGGSDVTATRAAYSARSGYIGSSAFVGNAYRFSRKFSIFGGISYSNFNNSKNEKSPLFKSKDGTSVFVGLTWFFFQSRELEVRQQ